MLTYKQYCSAHYVNSNFRLIEGTNYSTLKINP